MNLLGIDVGTTRCKTVVFNGCGEMLGSASQEYGVNCDAAAKAEQDPEGVWSAALQTLTEAIARSGIKQAAALSISVQGDAIIPLDAQFKPVHPAILGMDYRSKAQADLCQKRFGAFELFQRTGMRPHPMNSLTKVLLLRELSPAAWEKTSRIVTYADFILGKLGAEPVIDHTMASRTMAFDLHARAWDLKLLGELGISPNYWSRPIASGKAVGLLNKRIARDCGLNGDVLLVAGGHDQTCAALGAGLLRPGVGLISTGTAEVLSVALATPVLSRAMFDAYYPCYLHAVEGQYFTFALNHTGGILLQWWRDNFAWQDVAEARAKSVATYSLIDQRMPDGLSPVLFLPHLNGSGTPHCDLSSKGAVLGLTLATTRADVAKAILEGLSFELLMNLETMAACGVAVGELRAAGGGASSPRWLQLKADVLNRPVSTLQCAESACLGAALLAGVAAGNWASLAEAVSATVKTSAEYVPRREYAAAYAERFKTYAQVHPTLRNLHAHL